jgi:hypothetical protein
MLGKCRTTELHPQLLDTISQQDKSPFSKDRAQDGRSLSQTLKSTILRSTQGAPTSLWEGVFSAERVFRGSPRTGLPHCQGKPRGPLLAQKIAGWHVLWGVAILMVPVAVSQSHPKVWGSKGGILFMGLSTRLIPLVPPWC